MRQNTGTARGARVAVRLSREDRVRIDEAVKTRGYTSPSAFIRAAIQNELNGRPELTKTEDLITGGFEGISRDNVRIVRSQQALHALLDTFVKTVLTCLPEPSIDAQPQAVARAKDRYHLLIKAAGRSMSGDALAAPEGSGDTWHELMTSGKSGCGHQSLVVRRTNALHGLADSSCSCTTPAAREKSATAAPPAEKGEARVRTCSVALSG